MKHAPHMPARGLRLTAPAQSIVRGSELTAMDRVLIIAKLRGESVVVSGGMLRAFGHEARTARELLALVEVRA